MGRWRSVHAWSRRTIFGALAIAALGAGCRPLEAQSPAAAIELPTPVASPAAPRASTLAPSDPCRGRPRCTVLSRQDAGASAAGRDMVVVELSLGMRSEREDAPDSTFDCEEREVWLLHQRGLGAASTGPVDAPPPRLLLAMCNDGYGASGVGEDEITVRPNEIVHARLGGSSWRWSFATTARLDPPAVTEETSSGWWVLSANHDSESGFDYRTFAGFASAEWPECDAQGEMPDLGDTEIDARRSQPIVATALPAALTQGAMPEAAAVDVEACATRGASPDPRDAAYALVLDAASGTLLAQLRDDDFTPSDRLSIWATSQEPKGLHCWTSQRITPLVVDVEGHVVSGAASHPGVVVEAVASPDPGRRLLRVRLGALPTSISVAYRDVDKGRAAEVIATSDAEAAKGELIALGRVRPVEARRATCALSDGKLLPRPAEPPPAGEPLIDAP